MVLRSHRFLVFIAIEPIFFALRFLKEYLTKSEHERTMQVSLDKVITPTFSM